MRIIVIGATGTIGRAVTAYVTAVEGTMTGEILRP